jgi:hypothetical protein
VIKIDAFIFWALLSVTALAALIAGALWRDLRAMAAERRLRRDLEASAETINRMSAQIEMLRRGDSRAQIIKYLEESREIYNNRIKDSAWGSADEAYNRGVRHGLETLLLFLQGYL